MSLYTIILVIIALAPLLSSLKSTAFRKIVRTSTSNRYHPCSQYKLDSYASTSNKLNARFMSASDETESDSSTGTDSDLEEEVLNDVEVVTANLNSTETTAANSTEPVDPKAEILKAKISALLAQEKQLESAIAAERVNLLRTKDRISESGKTGYFIVQAQVAEFLVSSILLQLYIINIVKFCFI